MTSAPPFRGPRPAPPTPFGTDPDDPFAGLSPDEIEAVTTLAEWFGGAPGPASATGTTDSPGTYDPQSLIDFAHEAFYVPETARPIVLEPVQQAILWCMFDREFALEMGCPSGFQDLIYSTVKKSGKTTIAALIARWVTEQWGRMNEVYTLANDYEQAKGRIYDKLVKSIELDPRYDKRRNELPGIWDIVQREARHLESGSVAKALSNDYAGEAGSNPTATFWSELWGYKLDSSRKFWDELTPVPTRPHSIRLVETYAGYENESGLLTDHFQLATNPNDGARQLTRADVPWWPESQPDQEVLPLWVNPRARLFAYWDSGVIARRMPWQTREYYETQATTLRPNAFDRLHSNLWTSSVDTFVQPEWWAACFVGSLPPSEQPPPIEANPRQPCIVVADASVSGDCTGCALITRNPLNAEDVIVRLSRSWTPPPGGKIDYGSVDPPGLEPTLRDWFRRYNVVCFVYDPYQLHDMGTRFRNEGIVWAKPFNQGDLRLLADHQLYTYIRDRRILHYAGDPHDALREHVNNADARIAKADNTKMRIIKKTERSKIDLAVCLSMGTYECKRLNLA